MDFKNIAGAALGGKADMPLSSGSQATLQELIAKGIFKDKLLPLMTEAFAFAGKNKIGF